MGMATLSSPFDKSSFFKRPNEPQAIYAWKFWAHATIGKDRRVTKYGSRSTRTDSPIFDHGLDMEFYCLGDTFLSLIDSVTKRMTTL